MIAVDFPGANGTTSDREPCLAVPKMTVTEPDGITYIYVCFMPSYEDLQALAAGRALWMKFKAAPLPPLVLYTENEDGEPNVTP